MIGIGPKIWVNFIGWSEIIDLGLSNCVHFPALEEKVSDLEIAHMKFRKKSEKKMQSEDSILLDEKVTINKIGVFFSRFQTLRF